MFIYLAASHEGSHVDLTMTLRKFYVEDILSNQCITVTPDTELPEILKSIFHSQQEDFPVVEQGRLVGLLARIDLIARIHDVGLVGKVKDVMRTQFPVVGPKDLLTSVYAKMEGSKLKAIPVVKDGMLCGMLRMEDISKVYVIMSAKNK
jgi:CBS domain-containing protein